MTVMNRSMFRRPQSLPPFRGPMPVVRRNTGTPATGEMTVEDYVAKGYDPYEFEADKAMSQVEDYIAKGYDPYEFEADKAMSQKDKKGFFGKIFDNISDFFRFGRSDPESRLIIAGEYFDPEDPNFKMFIQNNYMSEGDTYIEGIEKFKAFAESQKRSEGSPEFGEMIKDGDFLARLLEYIDKMDIPQEEKSLKFREYLEKYGFPNFEEFFKDKEINPGKNMPYIINPDDPSFIPEEPKPYIIRPDDKGKIGVELFNRNQGSPMQGETVNPENVGIMDGFNENPDDVAKKVLEEGQESKKAFDESENYDELMQAIRGDDLTEEDRRKELAMVVGEGDANKTPDSVLVLVQPVMQMLDQGAASTGIGQVESGAMQMPAQPVGIATGGQVQKFFAGGGVNQRFEEILPTYLGIADRFRNPNEGQADTLFALSRFGRNLREGNDPVDAGLTFFDEAYALGKQKADQDKKINMQLAMQALGAANAQEIAAIKKDAEKTKNKKTLVVGLNSKTDRLIATLLGLTKEVPTYGYKDPNLTDDEFSAVQEKEGKTKIIDLDRLYELYGEGTELQFNYNFTEFLGKKGSGIRYEGVKDKADGGIVERSEGTPPEGENSSQTQNLDFGVIDVPMIVGTGERDDIIKILLGTDAALQELMDMKQLIVDDPALAGLPGMILEKTRGLFTIFDQLDNAYLNDKLIGSDSGIYKFFDRPAITQINKMKKRISKALADLASFKGTRQPTIGQLEETQTETDPAGRFGSLVSLEKIDAVGDEMVMLIKQLLRGLGGPTQGTTATQSKVTFDTDYVKDQYDKLDVYLNTLKTLTATEGTEGFADKESYTIEELEKLVKENKLGG